MSKKNPFCGKLTTRILPLLLAILMAFTMATPTVFAAQGSDTVLTTGEEGHKDNTDGLLPSDESETAGENEALNEQETPGEEDLGGGENPSDETPGQEAAAEESYKAALYALIEKAEALAEDDYTATSRDALAAALTGAKAAAENADAAKEEIDTAMSALDAAIAGLDAAVAVTADTLVETFDYDYPLLYIAAVYGGNIDEEGDAATGVGASHSFIEIYNPNEEEVELSEYTIFYQGFPTQYIGNRSGWASHGLPEVKLPGKTSFLINAGETATGSAAPTSFPETLFDDEWEYGKFVTKGAKYVILHGENTIADDVVNPFDTDGNGTKIEGYVDMFGSAGNDEGDTDQIDGYETNFPGSGSSKQIGYVRSDRDTDTDDNAADFEPVNYGKDNIEPGDNGYPRSMGGSGAPVDPAYPKLHIAAVFGGGVSEKNKAADEVGASHSFVEIYNPNDEPVELDGYSLFYQGFPTQNIENRSGWASFDLPADVTLPAGESFLINCGGTDYAASETPTIFPDELFDVTWFGAPDFVTKGAKYVITYNVDSIDASVVNPFNHNGAGQIPGYVDMFGSAGNDDGETDGQDGYETAYHGAGDGSSKQKGYVRVDRDVDTDNNAADFELVTYGDGIEPGDNGYPRSMGGSDTPVDPFDPDYPLLYIAAVYGGNISEEGKTADGVGASHSFIEVYNPNDFEVDLAEYTLFYQGFPTQQISRRTGWQSYSFKDIDLAPHTSYLINAGETDTGSAAPTAFPEDMFDDTWSHGKFVTKGAKYVIMHGNNTIGADVVNPFNHNGAGRIPGYVDMFGSAGNDDGETDGQDGYETAYHGASQGSSKQKGYVRIDRDTDTDNNEADFELVTYGDGVAPGENGYPRGTKDGPYGGSVGPVYPSEPIAWPGSGTITTDTHEFKSDSSGLDVRGDKLYMIDNKSNMWVMDIADDGSVEFADGWASGKRVQFKGGSMPNGEDGGPDSEGITVDGSGNVYLATERDNRNDEVNSNKILQIDPDPNAAFLAATKEWDLTTILPDVPVNTGIEAIEWVSDGAVDGKLFDMNENAPFDHSKYSGSLDGVFFVAFENNGIAYAFVLNNDGTATKVAEIDAQMGEAMALDYDSEGYLWIVTDNGSDNLAARAKLNGTATATIEYVLPPSGVVTSRNNEGFAIGGEIADGVRAVYRFADDVSTGALTIGSIGGDVPDPGDDVYALTLVAEAGGSITNGTSANYGEGDEISITATANVDYKFTGWTSSDGGSFADATSASTKFTMPGNATTVTAAFEYTGDGDEPDYYTLTLVAQQGGRISTGTNGSHEEGDVIAIAASADANYEFSGWTSSNGGTFANSANASTTFTMPAAATTVTAKFTKKDSGTGGGSNPDPGDNDDEDDDDDNRYDRDDDDDDDDNDSTSGGSGGGSSTGSANRGTAQESWMTSTNATETSKSTGIFGVRGSAWDEIGGSMHHDTVTGNAVQVRVYIDNPSQMTQDAYLSAYVSGPVVDSVRATFEKWFTNDEIRVVHFDQKGAWEQPVRVAAKIDLTGMDRNNLYLYYYNAEDNTYRRLAVAEYAIDANGYLHFFTEFAGDIIVSDGSLTKQELANVASVGSTNDTLNYMMRPAATEIKVSTLSGSETQAPATPKLVEMSKLASEVEADTDTDVEILPVSYEPDAVSFEAIMPDSDAQTAENNNAVVWIVLAALLLAGGLWVVIRRRGQNSGN